MQHEKMNPGCVAAQAGVRDAKAVSAGEPNLTLFPLTTKAARLIFEGHDGPVVIVIRGRELWSLRELIRAGAHGVTPIERPAPRWSHYIFKLRALGLDIETIREPHGGTYPGTHGRYVLHTPVALGGGA